jgi:hypothetical protein
MFLFIPLRNNQNISLPPPNTEISLHLLYSINKGHIIAPIDSETLDIIASSIHDNFQNKIESNFLYIKNVKEYLDCEVDKILNDDNNVNSLISCNPFEYITPLYPQILMVDKKIFNILLPLGFEIFNKFPNKEITFFLFNNIQFINSTRFIGIRNFDNIRFYNENVSDFVTIYKIKVPVDILFYILSICIYYHFGINGFEKSIASIVDAISEKYYNITRINISPDKIQDELDIIRNVWNTYKDIVVYWKYLPSRLHDIRNEMIYEFYKKVYFAMEEVCLLKKEFSEFPRKKLLFVYCKEIKNINELYVEYIMKSRRISLDIDIDISVKEKDEYGEYLLFKRIY